MCIAVVVVVVVVVVVAVVDLCISHNRCTKGTSFLPSSSRCLQCVSIVPSPSLSWRVGKSVQVSMCSELPPFQSPFGLKLQGLASVELLVVFIQFFSPMDFCHFLPNPFSQWI